MEESGHRGDEHLAARQRELWLGLSSILAPFFFRGNTSDNTSGRGALSRKLRQAAGDNAQTHGLDLANQEIPPKAGTFRK